MNAKTILPVIMLLLLFAGCNNNKKPSARVNPWSDEVSTSINISDRQVLVPFTRLDNGLAQVEIKMNGVPFNMCGGTQVLQ